MTDCYSGYNELMRSDGIKQLISSAHKRCLFAEAVKMQPKDTRGLAAADALHGVRRPADQRQARRECDPSFVIRRLR